MLGVCIERSVEFFEGSDIELRYDGGIDGGIGLGVWEVEVVVVMELVED